MSGASFDASKEPSKLPNDAPEPPEVVLLLKQLHLPSNARRLWQVEESSESRNSGGPASDDGNPLGGRENAGHGSAGWRGGRRGSGRKEEEVALPEIR